MCADNSMLKNIKRIKINVQNLSSGEKWGRERKYVPQSTGMYMCSNSMYACMDALQTAKPCIVSFYIELVSCLKSEKLYTHTGEFYNCDSVSTTAFFAVNDCIWRENGRICWSPI